MYFWATVLSCCTCLSWAGKASIWVTQLNGSDSGSSVSALTKAPRLNLDPQLMKLSSQVQSQSSEVSVFQQLSLQLLPNLTHQQSSAICLKRPLIQPLVSHQKVRPELFVPEQQPQITPLSQQQHPATACTSQEQSPHPPPVSQQQVLLEKFTKTELVGKVKTSIDAILYSV